MYYPKDPNNPNYLKDLAYMNKYLKNNNGSALLMTLIMLSSVLIVTLASADLITSGIVASRLEQSSIIAYYAAEAGIERSLWEVRKNSNPQPSFSDNLSIDSSYGVDYATSTATTTHISIGSYKESKRSVEVNYDTQ